MVPATLAHAARQLSGREHARVGEARRGERPDDALVHGVGPHAPSALDAQAVRHVVGHRHRVEERRPLEHDPHAPAHGHQLLRGRAPDVKAVPDDLAAVDVQEPADELEQHALSAARGPEQREDLAAPHVEVEPAEHLLRAEALPHVAQFQCARARRLVPGGVTLVSMDVPRCSDHAPRRRRRWSRSGCVARTGTARPSARHPPDRQPRSYGTAFAAVPSRSRQ